MQPRDKHGALPVSSPMAVEPPAKRRSGSFRFGAAFDVVSARRSVNGLKAVQCGPIML